MAREYIYIRRGLQRCRFKDAGNAKASKTWNDNRRTPRFFYMPQRLTTIRIAGSSYAPIDKE